MPSLYSGSGNRFVMIDARQKGVLEEYALPRIIDLCQQHKTDGLILLTLPADEPDLDFVMHFFNPDGTSGMMCGNGGRCVVFFAYQLGIRPAELHYRFRAADGIHTADLLSHQEPHSPADISIHSGYSPAEISGLHGQCATVRLSMCDAWGYQPILNGLFLNTGTRHFVTFVDDVENIDIESAKPIRWHEAFAPEGTNVNFVQQLAPFALKIRTFEKGVEGETLACGTGIVAAALAAHSKDTCLATSPSLLGSASSPSLSISPISSDSARLSYSVQARESTLTVDFLSTQPATDIHLTGPVEIL